MASQDAHFIQDVSQLSLSNGGFSAGQPPDPFTAKNGLVVVDIKDRFTQAVKTMQPGEVIKDAFFNLFDSVAALEIMDPKMDSGCVESTDELDEHYNVALPLSFKQVLGIIDQLICHEMAWHLGYPLAQTLLTSVYCEALLMPNPLNISQATFSRAEDTAIQQSPELVVLRAYCLGMLKTCYFVNERIKSEHYYEEEDFVTNTYHRALLKDVSRRDIQEAITYAQDQLELLRKPDIDSVVDGLLARLRFRTAFLEAAWCDLDTSPVGTSKDPWASALRQLPLIKSSHELGQPVDASFSAKIQRKLASTMPPRAIVNIDFGEAFNHLQRLFEDGLEAIEVLNYSDPQSLQTFVSTFQAKKPQPLVFVRTVLQYFLFWDMQILGSKSIRELIDDDLAIVAMAASAVLDRANDEVEAVQDPRFVIAQQMELFRQRAAPPYLDVLRTFCQNRCRVRRTLCHVVRAWDSLQIDADEIEQVIQLQIKNYNAANANFPRQLSKFSLPIDSHSQPLSSWTYVNKLKLMELIVQLGFELQVYQPDELAGMYWYLSYLAKCRVQQLRRIKTYTERTTHEVLAQQNTPEPAIEQQMGWALSYSRLTMLEAVATWQLADALSIIYVVLLRTNSLERLPRPYGNDELRYELRMKPFASIGIPELPTFHEFNSNTNQPDVSSLDLIRYAESAVGGAKTALETLTKLDAEESFSTGSHDRWLLLAKNALKACISTAVVLADLKKRVSVSQVEEDGVAARFKAEVPTPEKSYHEWWIIPKLSTV